MIESIKIKVGGKAIEVTLEELRKLRDELNAAFPERHLHQFPISQPRNIKNPYQPKSPYENGTPSTWVSVLPLN